MKLLAELLKSQREPARPANPANPANAANPPAPAPEKPAPISRISNISKGPEGEAMHARLRMLAEAEGVEPGLVDTLAAADLADCAGLPDTALRAYVQALADTATRNAGRVPDSYTAPALCAHCGPVWLSPDTVGQCEPDGWPRVLGCPWCHVHLPDSMAMPRPPVASAICAHFAPDTVNPDAGMGHCACGHHYPGQRHTCTQYQPKGTTP